MFWFWFIPFVLSLAYLIFDKNVRKRAEPTGVESRSVQFVCACCFTFGLMYVKMNVSSNRWTWYWYAAHMITALIYICSLSFTNIRPFTLSVVGVVGSGWCVGYLFEPGCTPWVNLISYVGLTGILTTRKDIFQAALVYFAAYVFYLGGHVDTGVSWETWCVIFAMSIGRSTGLFFAERAVKEVNWAILLLGYNVIYLMKIPQGVNDDVDGEDFMILLLITSGLCYFQLTVLIWLNNTGCVSLSMGFVCVDMLFTLAGDLSTQMLYLGWACLGISVGVYANFFPSNQSLPDREPSVPPLPPDSPKKKRVVVQPSAPVVLPSLDQEGVIQGEIV